ncbi:MAG TPA: amidohydrolase family protein [Candidatus Cybelea sp.]|nr:amidohydrolase family protein [Candidatus Cybelea sp.]
MQPVFDLSSVHRLKYADAVDADGHVLEAADLWENYIEQRYKGRALRIRRDADGLEYLEIGGQPSKMTRRGYPATLGRMGQRELEAFKPHPDKTYAANMPFGACDMEQRIKLLDAEGLDAAVLYPTLGILWEAELDDAELSQAYCRAYNRWIADFCRKSRGRLVPIAHLSLGNPEAAAVELGRAVKDGCRGAFVVPFTWTKKPHGHPVHDPIFAKAVELDVPIAIHPAFEPFAIRSQRFENAHRLSLLASATAADGVRHAFTTFFDFATFDRFPALKLVILESGAGWIGYWLDRLDGVVTSTYLGGRAPLKHKPSDYFRRQCWISADPDERTVPALAAIYGSDRFFWASDYPHPDHTGDYLEALEGMVGAMPAKARGQLLGANVRAAYKF